LRRHRPESGVGAFDWTAGAFAQALLEPLVHEGIARNWLLELRWTP